MVVTPGSARILLRNSGSAKAKPPASSIRTSHSRFSGFIYILFRPFLSLPRISLRPGTGTYVVDGDFQTVGNFGNGFVQRFNHVEHYARVGFLALLVNRYARKQRQAGSNDFLIPCQTFRKQYSLKTAAGVGQFQKSIFVAGFADTLLKRVDAAGHFGAVLSPVRMLRKISLQFLTPRRSMPLP